MHNGVSEKNKWSEAKAKNEILKALWKAELIKKDDVVLNYKQILEDFEAERSKTYTLKIDIKLLRDVSCDSDKLRTRDCHFYMVDENGIEQEIKTYENNLGFLTSSSKKGNSMADLMNKKMEKLREELNLLAEKIKAVDEQMKGE